MARRTAKAGPLWTQSGDTPQGEVLDVLSGCLKQLDPEGARGIRAHFGSTYLFMMEAERREDGEWWYEEGNELTQRRADELLDHLTSYLDAHAPRGHYFAGRRDHEGNITWGFWAKQKKERAAKNPDDDLLYGGFKKHKHPTPIEGLEDAWHYKGREIYIEGSDVVIARTVADRKPAVLAEWESTHPVPFIEACQAVELMHEQAKNRRRKPSEPADVPASCILRSRKGKGGIVRCQGYSIDLQPVAAEEAPSDLFAYEGMASALVMDPEDVVVGEALGWGSAETLTRAEKIIRKQPKQRNSDPGRVRARSFMRRMMSI